MRLWVVALALVVGGCSAATPTVTPKMSVESPATVQAERGSIVSTLVIPATVQAAAAVEVTAPAPGWYTVGDSAISYRLDSGGQGELALPPGLELTRALIRPGRHVPQNFPLAQAQAAGFALVAQLSESAAVRLYSVPVQATGQIKDGPGPFACPLADRVPHQLSTSDGVSLSLTCLVPPDLTVFAGMPALMAVVTASAKDVVLLPIEAVAGSTQHGRVWLVDTGGNRRLQDVQLGITDGIQIEIRSGVRPGDSVLVPAPDLGRP
jgi:hypothetical protein